LNQAFLIQLIGSAVAVAALVGIAAWARIARPQPPLDDATARALLADEFPSRPIEALWLAVDGKGALARSGELALVLSRIGDGHVARQIPWRSALDARVSAGRLVLELHDVGAPRAMLALASWPPEGTGG